MKILLFTENYHRGGVDTFIIMLINNWPEALDEITLVCNEDHPGLQDIRNKLRRPCRIITYNLKTYTWLAGKTHGNGFLDIIRKITSPVVRYLFFARTIMKLRPLLCDGGVDRLLVVNGGYPGGDTCRAAGITWGIWSGKQLSVHNFHNLAIPPKVVTAYQEKTIDALLARYTKAFVTVSKSSAKSMSVRPAIPNNKVVHIYNGLDVANPQNEIDVRQELGILPDTPLCLMLGTYEPRKGHNFLLRVFRRVVDQIPRAYFLTCGFGSKKEIIMLSKW